MYPDFLNEDFDVDISKIIQNKIKDRNEELFVIAKKVLYSELIPSNLLGISVAWESNEIAILFYHKGNLDGDIESFSLMAYIRIAAHYFKEYNHDKVKYLQIENFNEISNLTNLVFFH
jgi:hypothetical protein